MIYCLNYKIIKKVHVCKAVISSRNVPKLQMFLFECHLEKGLAAKRCKQLASRLNARNTINKQIPPEKGGTNFVCNYHKITFAIAGFRQLFHPFRVGFLISFPLFKNRG